MQARLFFQTKLVQAVLEGLADLEGSGLAGFDLDFFTGAGIAGGASGTDFAFKGAKANQLNLIAGFQSFSNNFNKSGQGLFGILFGQFGLLSQGDNQFGLVHCINLQYILCFHSRRVLPGIYLLPLQYTSISDNVKS